jgi:hypothetical protein
MKIEDQVIETFRVLPAAKQLEVLDLVRFLAQQFAVKLPLRSAAGLCEGLGVTLTAEEIDEARKEMWGNFPREDI